MTKNNIPAAKPAAPAKNAEKTEKEKKLMRRQSRLRALIRRGLSEEQITELNGNKDNRMVLCLYYTSFKLEGQTKIKKIYHRDKDHKVTSVEEKEIEVTLTGRQAAEKFLKNNNIEPIATGPTYCCVKTDINNVDNIVETLGTIGRSYVTSPEPQEAKQPDKEKMKKHQLAKKVDKKRKQVEKNEKRAYYAALRKGGVSGRIKKYNKTLADKIEKWLKERKASESKRAEKDKEYRASHRQLTSTEMKVNKRVRKAKKHMATIQRRKEVEKKAVVRNLAEHKKRVQNAQKPVQTEMKMAA